MKEILLLGAGLVTRPLVRYLLSFDDFFLTIATRTVSKAEKLIDNHPRGKALSLDVNSNEELESLIEKSDLVISLLPYTFHVKVAKLCLAHSINMVTTSYVSDEMKALDKEASEKGLLFLNEIGVDPGIDHMSAMKIMHDVENRGGKIVSFESITGGLPAPEANDNPFGYKFSWSPRGVVMAGRNSAYFLKDSNEVKIDGKDLFKNHWTKDVDELGTLEYYPNRDSMIYKDLYDLKDCHTIFRGTFRNPGWCDTLLSIARLGFLDDTERPELKGKTLAENMALMIGETEAAGIKEKTAKYLGIESNSEIISKLEWLGLFSDEKVDVSPYTYLDILTYLMLDKMPYQKGERDMIVMQHDFKAEFPDGKREEITSLLVDFGIPNGDSSMSRTVSLPAAIAVKLILRGKIKMTGVKIPVYPEIYNLVLPELEEMGIKFKETTRIV